MKHRLIAAVATGFFALAPALAIQSMGVATSPPGSLAHGMGSAVTSTANDAGLDTTNQVAMSPNQFIASIGKGGIDFGIADLQEVNHAPKGDPAQVGFRPAALRLYADAGID